MKFIKEVIIMLLVCLIGMLAFAVVFYEYIPSRKIVAEVSNYQQSDTVKALLADNVDSTTNDVILTFQEGDYEVTSADLNNYEITNDYVPGKANPFAVIVQEVTDTSTTDKNTTTSTNKNTNTTNKDSNTTTTEEDSDKTDEYIKDNGTK